VFTRVLYGARYDLLIAVLAVALAAGVGTPLGLLAGYFRGWTDTVIMRTMDLLLAFPNILLAMTLAAVLGPSLNNAILAVAIVGIAGYARIAYASTLSAKSEVYVEAARALGAAHHRLMLRAILPAILAPIVIRGTLGMGFTILLAAGLGFIGLGAQPPTPEWGAMINEGRNQVILGRWWTSRVPRPGDRAAGDRLQPARRRPARRARPADAVRPAAFSQAGGAPAGAVGPAARTASRTISRKPSGRRAARPTKSPWTGIGHQLGRVVGRDAAAVDDRRAGRRPSLRRHRRGRPGWRGGGRTRRRARPPPAARSPRRARRR
jgi:hypothetical protein